MHVQAEMAWQERLMPCPGLGPLGGAQPGQKEMVLLVKTKPSPHWLDKVWQQERGLGRRKKSKKQPVPLLPHPPTSVHVLETLVFSHIGPSVRMPFLPLFIGLSSIVLQNSAKHHLL